MQNRLNLTLKLQQVNVRVDVSSICRMRCKLFHGTSKTPNLFTFT
uniref:Uncharacterized protein n=1 Tax=Human betaherpesvirus 6 TaxID=10368 RepID=A0A5P9U4A2_9BETA|nr:hypothetical protein [Human betaherpesvirus 6]